MRFAMRTMFVYLRGLRFFLFVVFISGQLGAQQKALHEEYDAFYYGQVGDDIAQSFVQAIAVESPEPGASVQHDVPIILKAPGMDEVSLFCWQQPEHGDVWAAGRNAHIATQRSEGDHAFRIVFPADDFPHGPITLRLYARNSKGKQDYYELQLFNRGGARWRQGIPPCDPPGAKGMRLVFADDFDGPLSISSDGHGARYAAHKTGGGDFSGWPFSDPVGDQQPFSQCDTYLRIHASKPAGTKGRTGILSSLRADGTGLCVPVPAYFECRFVAQSAPGSWPAFWTLTKGTLGLDKTDPRYAAIQAMGTDELDIIEAYGGYGAKNPNARGVYHSVSHFWQQNPPPAWSINVTPEGALNPGYRPVNFRTDTLMLGEKSAWSWTFHTYGLAITETDTIYYFDNIEIGRHPTAPVSRKQPAWFLINYAIGGLSGWPIDLERYGNRSDMWVDFVRVYCGAAHAPELRVEGFAGIEPARVSCVSSTPDAAIYYTLDGSDPTPHAVRYSEPLMVNRPCVVKAVAYRDGLARSPVSEAVVTAPPGVPGSVGIQFRSAREKTAGLSKNDIAGIDAAAQANWNTVQPEAHAITGLITAEGRIVTGLSMRCSETIPVRAGESWGFEGTMRTLRHGAVAAPATIMLAGIPYARYEIVVFLGAGIHAAQGKVCVRAGEQARGQVDPRNTYTFAYTWLKGQSVWATTSGEETPAPANTVRFVGNSASEIEIHISHVKGQGWCGISAIQLIPCE